MTDSEMLNLYDEAQEKPLSEIIRLHVNAYYRSHGDGLPSSGVYARLLPLFEKPLIEITLKATGGNQIKSAHVLGINRNTLRKKIATLGIELPEKRLAKSIK